MSSQFTNYKLLHCEVLVDVRASSNCFKFKNSGMRSWFNDHQLNPLSSYHEATWNTRSKSNTGKTARSHAHQLQNKAEAKGNIFPWKQVSILLPCTLEQPIWLIAPRQHQDRSPTPQRLRQDLFFFLAVPCLMVRSLAATPTPELSNATIACRGHIFNSLFAYLPSYLQRPGTNRTRSIQG